MCVCSCRRDKNHFHLPTSRSFKQKQFFFFHREEKMRSCIIAPNRMEVNFILSKMLYSHRVGRGLEIPARSLVCTNQLSARENNYYSRQIVRVIEQERDFRWRIRYLARMCNAVRRRRRTPRNLPAYATVYIYIPYPILPAIHRVHLCRKASVHGLQSGYWLHELHSL